MHILVIDVGGTNVKLMISDDHEVRKFPSGGLLTASQMAEQVLKTAKDWTYDAVSIGFPGPVEHERIVDDPPNLGSGWKGFDFAAAFGKPTRIMNDAAMQALGSYDGGRMLFLGLGTGLGSTLIVDNVVISLEFGELRYSSRGTFADHVGREALKKLGEEKWKRAVLKIVEKLGSACRADYVVLGGGNVKRFKKLPEGVRRGDNRNAFLGGARLWETLPQLADPEHGKWVIT
jgi:polyphosphate glucokinase